MKFDDLEDTKHLALQCPRGDGEHNYIPSEWLVTTLSKQLRELVCTRCFHRVLMDDIKKMFMAPVSPTTEREIFYNELEKLPS